MNSEDLKNILELLEFIPRSKILRDLNVTPGWSYHGPVEKQEVKLGPGRYDLPIIKVEKEDHNNPNNWFYYRTKPHYEIISFLCLDSSKVIKAAENVFRRNGRQVDITLIDGNKITTVLDNKGEIIEVESKNLLLSSYELYLESLYDENVMMFPSLKDLKDVEDINESYGKEPTIVFKKYPWFLEEDDNFEGFFKPLKLNENCIGKVQLMEGKFWVICLEGRPLTLHRRYRSRGKRKATHIGGLITRSVI